MFVNRREFLGGAVGFIVIALFLPLVDLIQGLTG